MTGQESNIDQDKLKFLREVDYIKSKLGAFDAKKISIKVWFERFECLTEMLGWVNEQRIDSLVHLLGPALDRLAQQKKKSNTFDIYLSCKRQIIELVDQLLTATSSLTMYDHIVYNVMEAFDTNDFTNPEKRYWLGCIASPEYYRKLGTDESLKGRGTYKKVLALTDLAI